jgi:hypothetical protein
MATAGMRTDSSSPRGVPRVGGLATNLAGICWCGCGRRVSHGKTFLAGHDKVAEARVIRERYGSVAQFLLAHGCSPFGPPPHLHPRWEPTRNRTLHTLGRILQPAALVVVAVFDPAQHAWPSISSRQVGEGRPPAWREEIIAAGRRLAFEFSDPRAEALVLARAELATPRFRAAVAALDEAQTAGQAVEAQVPLIRELAAAEAELDLDTRSPVDRAVVRFRQTGDAAEYEADLVEVVGTDPDDVRAWVHLGELAFDYLDRCPRPQRDDVLAAAHEYFEIAVCVGELSLPDGFGGVMSSDRVTNRPWLRALDGLLRTTRRQGEVEAATRLARSLLWLDPQDRAGAGAALDALGQASSGARAPVTD